MLKKTLIILSVIFCILCAYQISFASNTANNIKNTINSGTDAVVDGVQNLAEDVRNGVGMAENGIEDALTMNTNNTMVDNTMTATGNTDGTTYNATRTADTLTTGTRADNTTMWVWLIVAIAAIVIVALVWFYGTQNHID